MKSSRRWQRRTGKGYTRTALFGLIALREAIIPQDLQKKRYTHSGLLSATTTGGIREFERHFYDLLDLSKEGEFTQYADTANPGEHCERMADEVGIKGYLASISTACSSSANAIIEGAQLIRNNLLDVAICGGSEALSKFTINGFNSLMIVDPQTLSAFRQYEKGIESRGRRCIHCSRVREIHQSEKTKRRSQN